MLFPSKSMEVDRSPLGQELSESDRQRLLRYTIYWQFYLGKHWAWKREDGEPQITVNYVKTFVNKAISFMWGEDGFTLTLPDVTKAVLGPILDDIWKANNKALWCWEAPQMGGVTGDLFVKITYQDANEENGLEKGIVRLIVLNSNHCFPKWNEHDRTILKEFKISYEYDTPDGNGKTKRVTYTEVLTRDKFSTKMGDNPVKETPNPLGFIPIVHIRNIPIAGASFGLSDCNDIVGINKEFNEKLTNVSDIINYHQAPVTVIFGARATTLEKGANKVWSGLPKDAKVENLNMNADLNGSMSFMEVLKNGLHETGNIPESALGGGQALSNTSAVALQIQYQPMIDMKHVKALTYGSGIELINKMALKVWEMRNGKSLKDSFKGKVPDNFDVYENKVVFPDTLPKDNLILLQEIQYRMSSPFPTITPPMALEMLGTKPSDIPKILNQIVKWMPLMRMGGEGEGQEGENAPKPKLELPIDEEPSIPALTSGDSLQMSEFGPTEKSTGAGLNLGIVRADSSGQYNPLSIL